MFTQPAHSTRSIVGKDLTEGQQVGVQRNDPPAGAPPGRRGRMIALLGLAALLLVGGCGSGGGSAEVRCSGADCRAVVTGTPVEVSEPESSGSMALVMGTSTSKPKPTTTKPSTSKPRPTTRTSRPAGSYDDGRDEVDFVVRTVGPGWVDIEEDGVRRVPAGEVFAEDDTIVRVDSADGRTATFTWQR